MTNEELELQIALGTLYSETCMEIVRCSKDVDELAQIFTLVIEGQKYDEMDRYYICYWFTRNYFTPDFILQNLCDSKIYNIKYTHIMDKAAQNALEHKKMRNENK